MPHTISDSVRDSIKVFPKCQIKILPRCDFHHFTCAKHTRFTKVVEHLVGNNSRALGIVKSDIRRHVHSWDRLKQIDHDHRDASHGGSTKRRLNNLALIGLIAITSTRWLIRPSMMPAWSADTVRVAGDLVIISTSNSAEEASFAAALK